MLETNPGILPQLKMSAMREYVVAGSMHSKIDPETLQHYLIIIKTLKRISNDNKITWHGSSIYVRMSPTILVVILWDVLVFAQISLSPQVKRSVIISNKIGLYKLPHKMTNDLNLVSKKIKKFQENLKSPSIYSLTLSLLFKMVLF